MTRIDWSPFFVVKVASYDYHRWNMTAALTGNKILDVAVTAASEAGAAILAAAGHIDQLKVEQKSLNDYVSEVDRTAEKTIYTIVNQHFPEHGFMGEEYGDHQHTEGEYQWVVDPLDGTTNFLRSIPHYAVSIAVLRAGKVDIGVIYDPCKNELFSAIRGGGAYLNGSPIQVSNAGQMSGALLATGVPYSGDRLQRLDSFVGTLRGLLALQTSGIRRLGAAALDLAYVAAGRYEGFWEADLSIWDIAAGALLVEEAGGIVSGLNGDDHYLLSGNILAATPVVHDQMLAVTTACY